MKKLLIPNDAWLFGMPTDRNAEDYKELVDMYRKEGYSEGFISKLLRLIRYITGRKEDGTGYK